MARQREDAPACLEGLASRSPHSASGHPIAIAPSSQPLRARIASRNPGGNRGHALSPGSRNVLANVRITRSGVNSATRARKPPFARGALQFDQLAREIAPCSIAKARVVDQFEMIPVAPALPDQHRLVLREELGDRETERLAGAARVEPGVASLRRNRRRAAGRRARGRWTMRSWLEKRRC